MQVVLVIGMVFLGKTVCEYDVDMYVVIFNKNKIHR